MQVRSKLRLFQDALLQLLHRDPAKRPSMKQFCHTCATILGEQAEPTVSVEQGAATGTRTLEDNEVSVVKHPHEDPEFLHGVESGTEVNDRVVITHLRPSRAI
jgi:hypothetical protein